MREREATATGGWEGIRWDEEERRRVRERQIDRERER